MQLLPHRSVSVPDKKFLAHPFDLHFGSRLQQEKIQVTLKEGYSPYIDARWVQWVTSAFRSMGEKSVNRLTAMIIMFIHECEWQTKTEEKLFLSWEHQCRKWSESQQEQSIGYRIEGYYIRAAVPKSWLQRWMHIWEFTGVRLLGDTVPQQCGNK